MGDPGSWLFWDEVLGVTAEQIGTSTQECWGFQV